LRAVFITHLPVGFVVRVVRSTWLKYIGMPKSYQE